MPAAAVSAGASHSLSSGPPLTCLITPPCIPQLLSVLVPRSPTSSEQQQEVRAAQVLIQRCLSAGGDSQVLAAVKAFGVQLEGVEQVEEGQRGLGDDQLELLVQVCGGEGVGEV